MGCLFGPGFDSRQLHDEEFCSSAVMQFCSFAPWAKPTTLLRGLCPRLLISAPSGRITIHYSPFTSSRLILFLRDGFVSKWVQGSLFFNYMPRGLFTNYALMRENTL
jgi:hypothetical protein